jgi:hypothetical protein
VPNETAYFSVDTRLTKLLGETYRSTEAALKELVDNAWDADADIVWITLPTEPDDDMIIVQDDGVGMTPMMVRTEYLAIARDRRSRKGEKTAKYKRAVKGRKGIGKFAGLATARYMRVVSVSLSHCTTILIDREKVLEAATDLERVPLPMETKECLDKQQGTRIELTALNKSLLAPREEILREMLFYEYGRASAMQIIVNGVSLSFEDMRGVTYKDSCNFEGCGDVQLQFGISEKRPPYAGFVIKVASKSVGKPSFLGLDQDPNVPRWLLNRIFGEINIPDLPDGHVTADWGSIFDNSVPFQSICRWVRQRTREELEKTYKRDFELRKAHLQRDIDTRLARLPEHRRAYARDAVNKVLWKFYREHGERFETLANVLLDSLEHDEYWMVLQQIDAVSRNDVAQFAQALEAFGLVDLAMMSERAKSRLCFLDRFDELVANAETLERDIHRALERNLWILGTKYALLASNKTLRTTVERYLNQKYGGKHADKRPDLLLAQDSGDRYLLIELKRPPHPLSEEDAAQARRYRNELAPSLSSKAIDILLLGGRRESMDTRYDTQDLSFQTYTSVISQARYELEWLLREEG